MEIKIRHQGSDHKAEAQRIKNTLWIHHNGRTFAVDALQSRKSRAVGAGVASDQVLAPMPGKVTKIMVAIGQEISKGQAVLVMEAMKMEYTLKAEIAGTVSAISCQVGDQVTLGKAMAKIEPKKS
jgi:biotin carboxyl carrier protein